MISRDSISNGVNSEKKYKSINITKLEHEIVRDISTDSKYYAEDEMKKRAVLTSKDYDEFKNFVACSQLKPVQSSDMGQLFVGRRKSNESYNYNYNYNDNKCYSVQQQQNNEKRLAALMDDMNVDTNVDIIDDVALDGNAKNGDSNANNHSANTNTNTNTTQDGVALETAATTTTVILTEPPSNDINTAYEYVLNLKTKTKKKETKSKRKNKYKKKSKNKMMMGIPLVSSSDKIASKVNRSHDRGINKSSSCTCSCAGPQTAMDFEKEWKIYCEHSTFDNILQYLTISSEEDGHAMIEELKNKKNNSMKLSSLSFTNTSLSLPLSFPLPLVKIPTYLRLEPEQVSQSICKVEMNSNIMGQIIQTLQYLLSNYGNYGNYGHRIRNVNHKGQNENNEKEDGVDDDNDVNDDGGCNSNTYYSGSTSNGGTSNDGDIIQFVYRWIDALTKCGRFQLNIEFLNEEQKQCISCIFDALEHQTKTINGQKVLIFHEGGDDMNINMNIARLKSLFLCP